MQCTAIENVTRPFRKCEDTFSGQIYVPEFLLKYKNILFMYASAYLDQYILERNFKDRRFFIKVSVHKYTYIYQKYRSAFLTLVLAFLY